MAILVNKLAQAISGIMEAIDTGVTDAAGLIGAGVRPPEKVVFGGDIIMAVNDLSTERVTIQGASSVVTETGQVVTREDVFLNGVYNHTNTTIETPRITTQTTSASATTKTTPEDQAIGMVFEYPGLKSK
jgi:hypothetical protein